MEVVPELQPEVVPEGITVSEIGRSTGNAKLENSGKQLSRTSPKVRYIFFNFFLIHYNDLDLFLIINRESMMNSSIHRLVVNNTIKSVP